MLATTTIIQTSYRYSLGQECQQSEGTIQLRAATVDGKPWADLQDAVKMVEILGMNLSRYERKQKAG